jgi:hypothetical protein
MDSFDDELPPDLARLRNEISRGLYAQLPIHNEAIQQEDVPGVAYALARRLVLAYRMEPVGTPREANDDDEDGDGDDVSLDAATFRGSALGPARYPIFDWESR